MVILKWLWLMNHKGAPKHGPGKCLRSLCEVERERLENALKNTENSNLLIFFEPKSTSIPLDPPIWQWIWQWIWQ